nr:cytochrome P450 2F1-like [Pongo abelii]
MEEVHVLTKPAGNPSCMYPQGTFVIPLLVTVHRNPTQFKDPDCFNPTNFLDKGKFQGNDAFMPFASGAGRGGRGPAWTGSGVHGAHYAPVYPAKQMCLGAGLAHSDIFLFLTATLQRFCLLPVVNPGTSNLTCSALAWAVSPQPSSSSQWPAEVRLHYGGLTGPQTSIPSLVNKGPKLQMESDVCSSEQEAMTHLNPKSCILVGSDNASSQLSTPNGVMTRQGRT